MRNRMLFYYAPIFYSSVAGFRSYHSHFRPFKKPSRTNEAVGNSISAKRFFLARIYTPFTYCVLGYVLNRISFYCAPIFYTSATENRSHHRAFENLGRTDEAYGDADISGTI